MLLLVLSVVALVLPSASAQRPTPNVTVNVDWKNVTHTSKTTVSYQLVACPLVADESPIAKHVFDNMNNLQVRHARYASWFIFPKISVPELDAPSGLSQCVNAAEKSEVHLSCVKEPGPKGKISKIEFASYGAPAGVCQNWQSGVCTAKNVTDIVSKFCLGNAECRIPVSTEIFGDPNCTGGPDTYRLAVQIQCDPPRNNTYWNFEHFDPIVKNVLEATKDRKPILSFSTTPNWLWTQSGGAPIHYYPSDWRGIDWNYNVGNELVDPTCTAVGQYFGRLISWYTRGGFYDEYGQFYASPHRIDPSSFMIEILNEPEGEHSIGPELYICIYDAAQYWVREWADPDHKIEFVGLALESETNLDFFSEYLNLSNHKANTTLDWISYHRYAIGSTRTNITQWETDFFPDYDAFFPVIENIQKIRSELSPNTKTTMDEVGVILNDDNDPNAVDFPRIYFNAVSALFAYMVGHVTTLDIEVVGASQMVGYPKLDVMGGLDPDYSSVTLLNWTTGAGTARYHTLDLLSRAFAEGDKIVSTTSSSNDVYGLAFLGGRDQKQRRILVVNKLSIVSYVTIPNTKGTFWRVVDPTTGENPAKRFKSTSDTVRLEPWTVAIINLDENEEPHLAFE